MERRVPRRGGGNGFKLDTAGNETVLHAFKGGADGALPRASLIRDSEGSLYGTTSDGGAGYGVVFKLDAAGNETILHTFKGKDGRRPYAALIRDAAGNFYGTTAGGGAAGQGVVFKLDPTGKETVLYTFTGGADGAHPRGDLLLDPAGTLYGTTAYGGVHDVGVVFKIEP
jgi:uncharacterized repeat protein (TIGR03803 family)